VVFLAILCVVCLAILSAVCLLILAHGVGGTFSYRKSKKKKQDQKRIRIGRKLKAGYSTRNEKEIRNDKIMYCTVNVAG
jgi:hypothetical protein